MKPSNKSNNITIYLFGLLVSFTSFLALKYLHNNIYYAGIAFGLLVIILKFTASKRREIRYLRSGIRRIDKMTGEEFEECLKVHFKALGYSVGLTQTSRDFGADLIISKDNIKTAVQAKRYSNTVGIAAIQQAYTAAAYYDCDNALVVTNSFFTSPAIKLADKIGVELWDRDTIIDTFNIKQ